MIRNLLKVSLRNLFRQKSFTFINIIGLSVGLASAVLIASSVREDLLWDHFNKNYDNIYRVVQIQQFGGVESQHVAFNQYPLVPAMIRDLAEVETGARYKPWGRNLVQTDPDKPGLFVDQIVFVDSTFFDIFSYEFVEGNPNTALSRPENAILTQETAQRLFGNEDPMGRELTVFGDVRLTVAGVLKKPSTRSHQKFDILLPIYSGIEGISDQIDKWGGNTLTAYVVLCNGTDPKEVEKKFPEFIIQYRDIEGITFYLQALKDIHLRSSHIKYDHQYQRSSERDVMAYVGIGILLLLIAGINFINLSTAQSLLRAREVAVRKINGATRWVLVRQFLVEALLLAIISMVLAGIIAQLAAPGLSSLFGRPVEVHILGFGFNTFSLLILAFVLGLAAGTYPAIVLSSFHPITALRGSPFKGPKGIWLRRGLVIFQFTLAVVLIIATAVIYRQLAYAHTRDLGYDREQVILLRNSESLSPEDRVTFRDRIASIPGVVAATIVSDIPLGKTSQSTFSFQGIADEGWMASYSSMDPEALQTFGFRMAEGRWFSKEMSTDMGETDNVIALVLNQKAVRSLGLEHPV
ncbi:MAG: ABC transporter permease, partial [bacterium]